MSNDITIKAVGDISFGDFPFCQGFGIRSSMLYHHSHFDKIKKFLSNADIVFGNLETCLSDHGLITTQLRSNEMRGSPCSITLLKDAHFNVLNVANNHIMQHGEKAFTETIQSLRDNGIYPIGLRNEAQNPYIIVKQNKKIGFLGYAFEQDNYGNNRVEYSQKPIHLIIEEIKKVKKNVDILIVSCHWGVEFTNKPSPNVVVQGRMIIDAGADIILGHHSHVAQGIEFYSNGLIVYSLGNFLFDMSWDKKLRQSYIISISIGENIKYDIIPIFIRRNFQIDVHPRAKEMIFLHNKLCDIIKDEYGEYIDIERKNIEYYLMYNRLQRKNRWKAYLYFIKNLYKLNWKFFFPIVQLTARRWLTKIRVW